MWCWHLGHRCAGVIADALTLSPSRGRPHHHPEGWACHRQRCVGIVTVTTMALCWRLCQHHAGCALLHWRCHRHRAGTVTFIALAHGCYCCCCICVFATVALPSLPLHRPNVVVMGGCCWHRTDAVALASMPSHGRHCQWCTGAVAIILLASFWRFFQRHHHGWRHCHPCTGIVTVALALTPSLGVIANVIHALLKVTCMLESPSAATLPSWQHHCFW